MVIQFGVKEHIKMAETYQWAEEELAKQRKRELELLEDSRRYWQGETADAFRQEHEFMLMEGEYAAYMKHVRGMKEVMEDSIPRFRQLQQMVVELPTAYGLPCDDEAPETLRLDEEAVAQYHELSDEIIAKNRHFCEEMTRIMDGCEGLVDFSEEKRELEELREEMHQMEIFKRKLDEYADEMRRMDNWMVERLSEFVKIGDGGSMTGKGIASKEYQPERTGICRRMNRDDLPAEIMDVSELGVYSYVFGNVSTVEMEQYLDEMDKLCENGWISEEERKYLQSLLTASTHVPDSEKTIIMGILRDRLSYIENTKNVNSAGYQWIQDNLFTLAMYLEEKSLGWSDVTRQHVLSEYYNTYIRGNEPLLVMAGVAEVLDGEGLDWQRCQDIYDHYKWSEIENGCHVRNEWLKLYNSQTYYQFGYIPRNVEIIDSDNRTSWCSYESAYEEQYSFINKNGYKQMIARNEEVTAIILENNVIVNEDGRYWIAVGPKLINKDYPLDGKVQADDFVYGTYIDIIVSDSSTGEVYYIPCVIGDIKNHTYPNGQYHTGDPYPNSGENSHAEQDYSYVEFLCADAPEVNVLEGLNLTFEGAIVYEKE